VVILSPPLLNRRRQSTRSRESRDPVLLTDCGSRLAELLTDGKSLISTLKINILSADNLHSTIRNPQAEALLDLDFSSFRCPGVGAL